MVRFRSSKRKASGYSIFGDEKLEIVYGAVWVLHEAGMSRRGISEMLNVHEAQIDLFLCQAPERTSGRR